MVVSTSFSARFSVCFEVPFDKGANLVFALGDFLHPHQFKATIPNPLLIKEGPLPEWLGCSPPILGEPGVVRFPSDLFQNPPANGIQIIVHIRIQKS